MSDASKTSESPNTKNKYEKIISNLRQDDGWKPVGKLYEYQGFWYGPSLVQNVISTQASFTPQPTDIVLCSSPKSGTAWLKALAFSIVSRNQVNDSTNPLLKKLPHEIVPFLEIELAQDSNNRNLETPFVATHIPYSSLPRSILDSSCKIIYICRDPKDVLISHWNFDQQRMAKFMGHPFSSEEEQQGAPEKIVSMCSFENLSRLEVNKNGNYYLPDLPAFENKSFFRKDRRLRQNADHWIEAARSLLCFCIGGDLHRFSRNEI
ncbi:hypothetical protein D5086_022962 [Populus alba]|uniref:Uncharacterized protein n=1 Tax=Populus alba TaxID=43335 RepID=A0ACC4B903_POPAL